MKQPEKMTMASKALIGGIALLCSLLITSCKPKENSPVGFVLPPGDAMAGQTTFAALGCIHCHQVDDVSFTAKGGKMAPDLIVTIGGTQPKVKTYGQLVTAIIHPNADILRDDTRYVDVNGKSLMPDYTRTMTVQQMTDIVTFLQEHYDITLPNYDTQIIGYPYVTP
jgi:L-cysteine S-thiosulfotransferase